MYLIPSTLGEDKLLAAQVPKMFFENILRFFEVPTDSKITAQMWYELWYILGIKTSASIAFHPQSNGQSERTNHTFEQILHVYIHNKAPSAWLEHALPYTRFEIYSTIS